MTSGVLRDAELQICRMLNALVRNYGSLEAAMEEVVVISPHWQTVSKLGESIGAVPEDELAWSSRPPNADEDYGGFPEDPNDLKGWAVGANSTGEDSISSFEVMDQLVRALADPKVHPNMEKVMIVGHGEGGSFVQRYAMFTRVDVQGSIHMSFHVANPSVLLYLFDDRPLQPKKATCAQADNYTISHWKWNFQRLRNSSYREYMGEDCIGRANNYPYGLDGALPRAEGSLRAVDQPCTSCTLLLTTHAHSASRARARPSAAAARPWSLRPWAAPRPRQWART